MKRIRNQYGRQHHTYGRSAINARTFYWKERRITIRYLLIMLTGILMGSMYAVAAGAEALPCKVLQQQMEMLPNMNLWQVLQDKLLFVLLGVVYLVISGACLWGKRMSFLLPLLFGIEQGTIITDLLLLYGWSRWKYLIFSTVLPASLECFVWLLLCNHAYSCCRELSSNTAVQKRGKGGMWILGTLILAVLSTFESVMQRAFI